MTVSAPAQHKITVVKVRSRRTPGTERFNVARNGALGLGNPHKIETEADRDQVVEAFRQDLAKARSNCAAIAHPSGAMET